MASCTFRPLPSGQARADDHLRGNVRPHHLLCSLRAFVSEAASGKKGGADGVTKVRGFKEIDWDVQRLKLLHAIAPCHRLVFNDKPSRNASSRKSSGPNRDRGRAP